MRRWLLAGVALTALALTAACGGDDSSSSTPTPGSTASAPVASPTSPAPAAATATTATTVATNTAVPAFDAAYGGYPPETRTGVGSVDKAIVAILSANPSALQQMVTYGGFPCSTTGAPGRPPCPANVAEGARVFVFQAANCGYGYVQPPDVAPFVQYMARPGQKIYGAWKRTTPVGSFEYTILFAGPPTTAGGPPTASIADLDDAGVKAMTFACGESPDAYLAVQKPDNFILPPPKK